MIAREEFAKSILTWHKNNKKIVRIKKCDDASIKKKKGVYLCQDLD